MREQALIRPAVRSFPSQQIAAKHGFKVIDDVHEPAQFSAKDLKYASLLNKNREYRCNDKMCNMAIRPTVNLGLIDGESILKCQQDIPHAIRPNVIFLMGTRLSDSNGCLAVGYLYCCKIVWNIGFRVLDHDLQVLYSLANCE
ncbi:MAG: hypothetical protein AAB797_00305 [Patescibacteria group bacterium]